MEYLFHKNYLKNSRSCRHFRSKICTYSMYEIYSRSSSPFVLFQNVRQTIETSRRIRRREDRIHSIFYSMSTTNDGFECYSRGGFAKFEHKSLERGMCEAIVCGKVSRQNVNPTRGQGFTLHLDLYLSTSDTFHPSEEKSLYPKDPFNFLPFI